MNIKNLNDGQLHQNLLSLKSKESHIVASILAHLEEVYRRRLFAQYKCTSLYDYCIRILGYSNGEAHKKISACKLASHCKGVKESIASGELSLSNAASVQVFLNQSANLLRKNKELAGKMALTQSKGLETESRAKNQAIGTGHLLLGPDQPLQGFVSSSQNLDQSTMELEPSGQNLKQTNNHDQSPIELDSLVQNFDQSSPAINPSTQNLNLQSTLLDPQQIIERIKNKSSRECEMELEKIASECHLIFPEKKSSKRNYGDKTLLKIYLNRDQLQLLKSRLNISCEQELLQILIEEKLNTTEPRTEVRPKAKKLLSQKPRIISPSKRAKVFKMAQKKCENCGSKSHLQIDHIESVMKGGGNNIENLRVLCRSCNQRAAVNQLGLAKMDKFINRKYS